MDRRRACKQRPQVNSPDIVLVEGGAERADHMSVELKFGHYFGRKHSRSSHRHVTAAKGNRSWLQGDICSTVLLRL